ncbi:hypothetical protein WSM22_35910 [Cytophagales bacterium WSM2-2]|nr:hypothetical protein WSM22_35910 [Cytophagales bacterium WSM2-2]
MNSLLLYLIVSISSSSNSSSNSKIEFGGLTDTTTCYTWKAQAIEAQKAAIRQKKIAEQAVAEAAELKNKLEECQKSK